MTEFRWGTITDESPLRVQLDGDAAELPLTPDSLIDPATLSVDDRVRCEISRRRVVIHGVSGGGAQVDQSDLDALLALAAPTGAIDWTVALSAPAGWLACDGAAVSRTTYASLFSACNPTVGTFTITIASPGLATLTDHGLYTGQKVYLTTTGALPTGLSQNTDYWVIRVSSSTFRLASSYANAAAGTAINTSGSQSGTHTIRRTFGVGNGSTTFNVPDIKGRAIVGVDTSQAEFDGHGKPGGAKTHTLTVAEMPSHNHGGATSSDPAYNTTAIYTDDGTVDFFAHNWDGALVGNDATYQNKTIHDHDISSQGGGGAHNNLQPYIVLTPIIKT